METVHGSERAMADAALDRAGRLGASHADFRLARVATIDVRVRNGQVESAEDGEELAFGVRVVRDGAWGFVGGVTLTADAAARAAAQACEVAAAVRPLRAGPVELADEPVHGDRTWVSSYRTDPTEVPVGEHVARLRGWCDQLLSAGGVDQVRARILAVREDKFYADLAGTSARQRRVWMHPQVIAIRVDRDRGGFQSMRTLAPPVARGWEYVTGTGWDWAAELAAMPEHLAEQAAAEAVRPGEYDLVIDPTNLWLTIHETVGHATELDRALGYEEAYAGGSFASADRLHTLRYGSPLMTVTADRTTEHGLATIGFDDEGVAAQSWDLVRDGVLVGYQVDRHTARLLGMARSNGCAYADSGSHVPVQRMANVSLAATPDGPDTAALISDVSNGVYVVGDKSWSIDMQRYNFQFTGQRFYRIRKGRLAEPLRDVAYQGSTLTFWGALDGLGGPRTYLMSGASHCGKAQPGQLAGVSHGCPSALFRRVRVLDTSKEAGR